MLGAREEGVINNEFLSGGVTFNMACSSCLRDLVVVKSRKSGMSLPGANSGSHFYWLCDLG